MALKKSVIVEQIQNGPGIPKIKYSDIAESLHETIKSTLESGRDALVRGCSKFCVKDKQARKGWNPAFGEDLLLMPRHIVTFKCSLKLREKVNGGRHVLPQM